MEGRKKKKEEGGEQEKEWWQTEDKGIKPDATLKPGLCKCS